MTKRTITLASLALAVVAFVFLAAPWFALRNLQAAARDGDVHALAELVDYDAVRWGLRSQFATADSVPPPKLWEDPLGALSRAVHPPQTPVRIIDGYLTPSGLHQLVGDPLPLPALRHWGPGRVRFAVGPRNATLVTFQRHGFLEWRLVQLRVPTGGQLKAGD